MLNWISMLDIEITGKLFSNEWWTGISAFFAHVFSDVVAMIFKVLGLFADLLHIAFYIFSGIDINTKEIDGIYYIGTPEGRKNILDYFLFNDAIVKAYWVLAGIGLLLVVIFTIFKIVKQDYFDRSGPRSKGPIFRNVAISCISFLLVIPIFILIVHISSLLAISAMNALGVDTLEFAGAKIFQLSWSDDGQAMRMVNARLNSDKDATKFQWMMNLNNETLFALIDDGKYSKYDTVLKSVFPEVANGNGIDIILDNGRVVSSSNIHFYWYIYLVGVLSALKTLFTLITGMVRRLFNLVGLFIIAPAPISQYVLDDGAKYQQWQKRAIGEGLRVVSGTMCFSVYLMLLNLISDIEFIQAFQNVKGQVESSNSGIFNGSAVTEANVNVNLLSNNNVAQIEMLNLEFLPETSGNFLENIANCFMKIMMLYGAGSAVTELDGMFIKYIAPQGADVSGAMDGGAVAKGIQEGGQAIGKVIGKGADLASKAASLVGAGVGNVAGNITGAIKETGNVKNKILDAEVEGQQEEIDDAKKQGLTQEGPVNGTEGTGGTTSGEEQGTPTEGTQGVEQTGTPTETEGQQGDGDKPKDGTEQPQGTGDQSQGVEQTGTPTETEGQQGDGDKPKDGTSTQGGQTKETENKPQRRNSIGRWKTAGVFTGLLARRAGNELARLPLKGLKGLGKGTLGILKGAGTLTDKALGVFGIDTKGAIGSAVSNTIDGVKSKTAASYKGARERAKKSGEKSAVNNSNIAKAQAYRHARKERLAKAQQNVIKQSGIVEQDANDLQTKINEENESVNQVNEAQQNVQTAEGEVQAAEQEVVQTAAVAQSANNNVNDTQVDTMNKNINKTQQTINKEKNKMQTIETKYGSIDEIQAKMALLKKNGQKDSQEYKELELAQKNYKASQTKVKKEETKMQTQIDQRDTRQRTVNTMMNRNGELNKFMKPGATFAEVKEAITKEGSGASQELIDLFNSKEAESMFNTASIATARDANSRVHEAQENLGQKQKNLTDKQDKLKDAQNTYNTRHAATETARTKVATSVERVGKAQELANKLYNDVQSEVNDTGENGEVVKDWKHTGMRKVVRREGKKERKGREHAHETTGTRSSQATTRGTTVGQTAANKPQEVTPTQTQTTEGVQQSISGYIDGLENKNEEMRTAAQTAMGSANVDLFTGLGEVSVPTTETVNEERYNYDIFKDGIARIARGRNPNISEAQINGLINHLSGDALYKEKNKHHVNGRKLQEKFTHTHLNGQKVREYGVEFNLDDILELQQIANTFEHSNPYDKTSVPVTKEVKKPVSALEQVTGKQFGGQDDGIYDTGAIRKQLEAQGLLDETRRQALNNYDNQVQTYQAQMARFNANQSAYTAARSIIPTVTTTSTDITNQIQTNVQRYRSMEGQMQQLNQVVNSNGQMGVTPAVVQMINGLTGGKVQAGDTASIVQAAAQARGIVATQQANIISQTQGLEANQTELMQGLATMLNTMLNTKPTNNGTQGTQQTNTTQNAPQGNNTSQRRGSSQGVNNTTNNTQTTNTSSEGGQSVVNNIVNNYYGGEGSSNTTSTVTGMSTQSSASRPDFRAMKAQELAEERAQTAMSQYMSEMLRKSEQADKNLQEDVTHIRRKIDKED